MPLYPVLSYHPILNRTRFYHSLGPVTRMARIPYRGVLRPSRYTHPDRNHLDLTQTLSFVLTFLHSLCGGASCVRRRVTVDCKWVLVKAQIRWREDVISSALVTCFLISWTFLHVSVWLVCCRLKLRCGSLHNNVDLGRIADCWMRTGAHVCFNSVYWKCSSFQTAMRLDQDFHWRYFTAAGSERGKFPHCPGIAFFYYWR